MAVTRSFIMAVHSVPLALTPKPYCRIRASVSSHPTTLAFLRLDKSHQRNLCSSSSSRSYSTTRLNAAGLSEIEPDLSEEARDRWATNSISSDEFIYGEYDGHHTYHEGNEGTFWEGVVSEYEAAEPPSGFQGITAHQSLKQPQNPLQVFKVCSPQPRVRFASSGLPDAHGLFAGDCVHPQGLVSP